MMMLRTGQIQERWAVAGAIWVMAMTTTMVRVKKTC
jgi:hypothetical protein